MTECQSVVMQSKAGSQAGPPGDGGGGSVARKRGEAANGRRNDDSANPVREMPPCCSECISAWKKDEERGRRKERERERERGTSFENWLV
jgi:hypothetical protein